MSRGTITAYRKRPFHRYGKTITRPFQQRPLRMFWWNNFSLKNFVLGSLFFLSIFDFFFMFGIVESNHVSHPYEGYKVSHIPSHRSNQSVPWPSILKHTYQQVAMWIRMATLLLRSPM